VIEASVNDAVTSTFSDIIITHENNFSLSDNGNAITVESRQVSMHYQARIKYFLAHLMVK